MIFLHESSDLSPKPLDLLPGLPLDPVHLPLHFVVIDDQISDLLFPLPQGLPQLPRYPLVLQLLLLQVHQGGSYCVLMIGATSRCT